MESDTIKKAWSKDMEFREVILSRKSVRRFSDKEVEDESLLKYLNLLDWHPLGQVSNVVAIF